MDTPMKLISLATVCQRHRKGSAQAHSTFAKDSANTSLTEINLSRCVTVFLILLFGFSCYPINAQNPAPVTGKSDVGKKMDGLLVYGKGFMFSAKEPDGWHGDTEKIAQYYNSNLIFLPEDKTSRAAHVNIRIRVNRKETADPSEDMQTDMQGYRKQYPKVRFSDLAVSHPKYKISAKLFYIENDFYEYVAYIDPGAGVNMNFSVAMSKDSTPATPDELKTYQAVLEFPILDLWEYSLSVA